MAGRRAQQILRRRDGDKRAFFHDSNLGRDRFNVGNDVRRKNHELPESDLGKDIAKADALFGIEPGGGFIDDD